MEGKIEKHPTFESKKKLIEGLKKHNIETFDDVWNFCLKHGVADMIVIPKVGYPNLFRLLTVTMKYKAEKERQLTN